jgi:hypothetical protein
LYCQYSMPVEAPAAAPAAGTGVAAVTTAGAELAAVVAVAAALAVTAVLVGTPVAALTVVVVDAVDDADDTLVAAVGAEAGVAATTALVVVVETWAVPPQAVSSPSAAKPRPRPQPRRQARRDNVDGDTVTLLCPPVRGEPRRYPPDAGPSGGVDQACFPAATIHGAAPPVNAAGIVEYAVHAVAHGSPAAGRRVHPATA